MIREEEPDQRPTISIAIGLVHDGGGRVLLVRKKGARVFMQPGGKIEPGETLAEALVRELHEELGLRLTAETLVPAGTYMADAANEPGHRVVGALFLLPATPEVWPAAEIDEIAWVDPAATGAVPLAALTRDQILPRCLGPGGLLARKD